MVNTLTLLVMVAVYLALHGSMGFEAILIGVSAGYLSQLICFVLIYIRENKGKTDAFSTIKVLNRYYKLQRKKTSTS